MMKQSEPQKKKPKVETSDLTEQPKADHTKQNDTKVTQEPPQTTCAKEDRKRKPVSGGDNSVTKKKPRKQTTCKYCGKPGHTTPTCPKRKADAKAKSEK